MKNDNGPRVSPRHAWDYVPGPNGGHSTCSRCGSSIVYQVDACGAYHCFPKPEWLRNNPNDDRGTR